MIGYFTEYYTSDSYKPTQDLANQSLTGPATIIIGGLSLGMLSTLIPVVVVVIATLAAFFLSGGFANAGMGLYGIGLSAVGMLSTLGITLATDAYGPVADNAGGIAEMAHLPPNVRERTDALDSLGNTTAATGKGFAIASAALTALALIAEYANKIIEGLQTGVAKAGKRVLLVLLRPRHEGGGRHHQPEGRPDGPEGAHRPVPRRGAAVRVLRPGHAGRGPGRGRHGAGGAPAVQGEEGHPHRAR